MIPLETLTNESMFVFFRWNPKRQSEIDDLKQAAALAILERCERLNLSISKMTAKQRRDLVYRGAWAIKSEVYRQSLPPAPPIPENPDALPILPIARALYARLKKKGKRGRKSAALKGWIVSQRCVGDSFGLIAERSTLLNPNHRISEATARRYWAESLKILRRKPC